MFTGIIEDTGIVESARPIGGVTRLSVSSSLDLSDTHLGDSIAVDGVCLTVTDLVPGPRTQVAFDVGPESLRITALAQLRPGAKVHLERALRLSDRLGGHLVQGHVDGVGTLVERRTHDGTLELRIRAAKDVLRLCIHKGSITLDGVSLTVNALGDETFEVWLIPHTLERTHLGELRVGDLVNLENDLIGKYVERLLGQGRAGSSGVTLDLLAKAGFIEPSSG